MIFTDLDSSMAKFFLNIFTVFDFGHLQVVNWGSKLDQKFELCVCPISVKIEVFQNALNGICTTMKPTYDQNFSSI